MIKSITFLPGQEGYFTNKLYRHKSKARTFEFTDGINIITGRNGSGKTVMLKIIKLMCGIDECTYPVFPRPIDLKGWMSDEWGTMEQHIKDKVKNGGYPEVELSWDGSMVHHLNSKAFDASTALQRFMQGSMRPPTQEMFEMAETMLINMSNESAGEMAQYMLTKVFNLNTEYDSKPTGVNDTWEGAWKIFDEWIMSKPRDGKPTLLIDELDRHLDIDNQYYYWKYIAHLAKKWQVIVVSHSIFAFHADGNHIPLSKEYYNRVKKLKI